MKTWKATVQVNWFLCTKDSKSLFCHTTHEYHFDENDAWVKKYLPENPSENKVIDRYMSMSIIQTTMMFDAMADNKDPKMYATDTPRKIIIGGIDNTASRLYGEPVHSMYEIEYKGFEAI